jgi:hypothetical protein
LPGDVPTSDESYARRHAADWSIGDAAYLEWGVLVWLVAGSNGENLIRAAGPTRAGAWWAAVGQAQAVGMAGRTRGTEA